MINTFLCIKVVQKSFMKLQFPRALGAIDCTRVMLHSPIQSPCLLIDEEFRNRKGYFSLNVQAVFDADLKLMNVVACWYGSTHDATIFNNSILRAQCDTGQFDGYWLLGDSTYPNRSYLLTSLLNPSSEAEHRYNKAHIRTRNTIERTFGVWKRRSPAVPLTLRILLPVVQSIVIATAVLHNICRNSNVEEVPPEVDLDIPTNSNNEVNNSNMEAQDVQTRADLINNYFI